MPVLAFPIAKVPGATNLVAAQLTDDMIVSLATGDPHSAQTTLGELKKYFGVISTGTLYNNGGALGVVDASYPTTSAGAPGAIWSNAGQVSVVPGGTPFAGAPVFFGTITSTQLLLLGGLGLPLSDPQVLNQLWNLGGQVLISVGNPRALLYNNGGVLGVVDATYPTTSAGSPGSIWSNGGDVSVVPGGTHSAGTPVFFGSITSTQLLLLGGLGLPLSDPQVINQLWNLGGQVFISAGAPNTLLFNDGGVLGVMPSASWPSTSSGSPGSLWSNSGVATLVPGGTHALGSPVFFGSITASALLALGGLGLPTTAPTPGSLQLWVLNNEILVA